MQKSSKVQLGRCVPHSDSGLAINMVGQRTCSKAQSSKYSKTQLVYQSLQLSAPEKTFSLAWKIILPRWVMLVQICRWQ